MYFTIVYKFIFFDRSFECELKLLRDKYKMLRDKGSSSYEGHTRTTKYLVV